VGQQVAGERGVEFLYQDLRPGFGECRRMGKELDLYSQKYCGCVYSEWERFGKVDIARELGSV
jgi:predicted adenine nucleotide alpha hydrolase (AANH) superfamily ATPase